MSASLTHHRFHRGVTLVEMLVGVAIIVILAGLLWPAIDGAIVKAQGARCASNMRNISVTILDYVAEHNGAFPPYSLPTEDASGFGQERRWPTLFFESVGYDAFYCPTLQSPRYGQPQFVDYGYNYLFLGSQQNGRYGSGTWVDLGRPVARISAVQKPSQTLLLAESLLTVGSAANEVGFYILNYENNGSFRVDPRHGKGVLVSWVDGHLSHEVPDDDYNLPAKWFWANKEEYDDLH